MRRLGPVGHRPPSGISSPPAGGAEHPSQHLATYGGFAHADAYACYNDAYRTGRVKEMACMAHVRREFFALYESAKLPVAGEAVLRLKKAL